MKITETKIKVSDLVENYSDDGDGGVYGYNNRLVCQLCLQSLSCARFRACGDTCVMFPQKI